ncbi:MAG: hypothetical protein ACM3NT_01665 [Methylocystaceae bacterium]
MNAKQEVNRMFKPGKYWKEAANLLLALFILIAIDFVFKNVAGGLVQEGTINLHYTVTMNFIILWLLVLAAIWYIMRAVKKQAYAEKKAASKGERLINNLILSFPFILILMMRSLRLEKITVFSMNGLILLAMVFLLSMGCRWLSNR